jgi:hypothetical protein
VSELREISTVRKPLPWLSAPPEGCPFPPSSDIRGITFTGRYAIYTEADTWYPSWAADGHLYSPFTDGKVGTWSVGSVGILAATGQAKITGDDPFALEIIPLGSEFGSPLPYGGRYPCATLVKDGVWYYGTYCLDETSRGLNWDVLGPFVGFRISHDLGLTWEDTPHTAEQPLFAESGKNNAKVKIGAPHTVDFGKDMMHSPDGKAYFVGHGATDSHADLTWGSGDEIYLIRVEPTPETINDPEAYEFFGGLADGQPLWTRSFAEIEPIVSWPRHCGSVTMTFNAPLKRYLMWVTDCWPTVSVMDTYILEAAAIEGPWRLVTYMKEFGPQAYFVNQPSKFTSHDGRTGWLCYSANFTNLAKEKHGTVLHVPDLLEEKPPGSRYGMCLQEFELT